MWPQVVWQGGAKTAELPRHRAEAVERRRVAGQGAPAQGVVAGPFEQQVEQHGDVRRVVEHGRVRPVAGLPSRSTPVPVAALSAWQHEEPSALDPAPIAD